MLAAIIININPILVQLGPVAIRWYGLMYVVGIIVGLQATLPFVRRHGISDDQVWNIVGPCILTGLLGGRLFYVLQQPLAPFIAQPWRIIATWEGGMAFYGAIFLVLFTLWVLAPREKVPFWWLADGAGLLAAVGQFFGRIGNVVNGDILGSPTLLPWGFVYTNPNSFAPSHVIAYQPAAIYEMICDLVLIGVLFALQRRVKISGVLVSVYLLGYAVTQFAVFFLRDSEPIVAFGLKQAQLTSIVVFVAGLALLVWRLRAAPDKPAEAIAAEPAATPSSSAVADTA